MCSSHLENKNVKRACWIRSKTQVIQFPVSNGGQPDVYAESMSRLWRQQLPLPIVCLQHLLSRHTHCTKANVATEPWYKLTVLTILDALTRYRNIPYMLEGKGHSEGDESIRKAQVRALHMLLGKHDIWLSLSQRHKHSCKAEPSSMKPLPVVVSIAQGSHRYRERLPDRIQCVLHHFGFVADGEPGRVQKAS